MQSTKFKINYHTILQYFEMEISTHISCSMQQHFSTTCYSISFKSSLMRDAVNSTWGPKILQKTCGIAALSLDTKYTYRAVREESHKYADCQLCNPAKITPHALQKINAQKDETYSVQLWFVLVFQAFTDNEAELTYS